MEIQQEAGAWGWEVWPQEESLFNQLYWQPATIWTVCMVSMLHYYKHGTFILHT